LCYIALIATATLSSLGEAKAGTISEESVDRSVIETLAHQGATNLKVVSHVDLTASFATVSQWTFVAVQDSHSPIDLEEHGPIYICLVKARHADCSEKFYQQSGQVDTLFDTPYHLFAASVVYAGQNHSRPLFFVKMCAAQGGDGGRDIATALYRYDGDADRFTRIFLNHTGRNESEETRFVESGPLQGDVIVNYPTESAPYTYWIEVYRANYSGQYVRILHYRGRTVYGDGNPLAVADSEMPAILAHFGLWKEGSALPTPPRTPKRCSTLYMRTGEEWCK